MATHISTNSKGSLTIAGSGIASIKHITLETLSHIKEADKIYYLVTDPTTEAFIQDNATGACFDLQVFYDKNKVRYDSYVQMSEVMLRDVRAGLAVLGIFYGHPGVFVSPSHRAIAIALDEGFKASMLPGVSAEDYLFAELGFDPAVHGCSTYEATDLLVRNKPLNTSTHNIIWQVGAVGVGNMIFDNAKFYLLVDRLEEAFGPSHTVVHYIGATLPQSTSRIEKFSIADLRKDDVVRKFNTVSTFYVPPREVSPIVDTMARKLGYSEPGKQAMSLYPPTRWAGPDFTTAPAYGPHEKAVIAQLDQHTAPDGYKALRASDAMKKLTADLALRPNLLEKYKANPSAVVDAVAGLTEQEKVALKLNSAGPIYGVMQATPSDIANGIQPTTKEITAMDGKVEVSDIVIIVLLLV